LIGTARGATGVECNIYDPEMPGVPLPGKAKIIFIGSRGWGYARVLDKLSPAKKARQLAAGLDGSGGHGDFVILKIPRGAQEVTAKLGAAKAHEIFHCP
jgi:hypothetical protein